jgi:hypothetical protein
MDIKKWIKTDIFDQNPESIIKNIQEPVVFFAHLNGKESTVNRALGGSTYPG